MCSLEDCFSAGIHLFLLHLLGPEKEHEEVQRPLRCRGQNAGIEGV